MAGIMTTPMATAVATAAPEIAAKMAQARIVASPSPPRMCPNSSAGEAHQVRRDAALVHEVSGQHEERDGEQREGRQAAEDGLNQGGDRDGAADDGIDQGSSRPGPP